MPAIEKTFSTQKQTLRELERLTRVSCIHPRVHNAAIRIVDGCGARKDLCELKALYDAIKHGTPAVRGLEKGVKYLSDPVVADYWVAPHKLLEQCEDGACAEDCESASGMLIAALAATIGFTAGLRAWGSPERDGFSHLFAVVKLPKNCPEELIGTPIRELLEDENAWKTVTMDTTVPRAYVGWKPPPGRIMTAWIHRDEGD